MAKAEFDAWNSYLEARKEHISGLKQEKKSQDDNIDYFEPHKETHYHYSH